LVEGAGPPVSSPIKRSADRNGNPLWADLSATAGTRQCIEEAEARDLDVFELGPPRQ